MFSYNYSWTHYIDKSDILLCSLLTIITFGLVVVCMFGMYYLTASAASQNIHLGISRYWTETSIGVFLGIVVCMFVCIYGQFNYNKAIILYWCWFHVSFFSTFLKSFDCIISNIQRAKRYWAISQSAQNFQFPHNFFILCFSSLF